MSGNRGLVVRMLSLIMGLTVILVGCGGSVESEGVSNQQALSASEVAPDKGYLTLSVNPEVTIEYNAEGVVTDIIGKNDDGVEIIKNYTDYIGKNSSEVLEDLINLIDEAGYFIEDSDVTPRQIVLEVEPRSVMPGDDFLNEMSRSVEYTVSELDLPNIKADGDDYISLDEAKMIALEDAKVDKADAKFDDKEFDFEDGMAIYELEFKAKGTEYEYDIHAVIGKIINKEIDHDDKKPIAKSPSKSSESQVTTNAKPKKSAAQPKEHAQQQPVPKQTAPASKPVEKPVSKKESKAPQPAKKENPAPVKKEPISAEKAKQIAQNHAGVTASYFDDVELDEDDERLTWEVEFMSGNLEVEIEIDAYSGAVIDFERDYDD